MGGQRLILKPLVKRLHRAEQSQTLRTVFSFHILVLSCDLHTVEFHGGIASRACTEQVIRKEGSLVAQRCTLLLEMIINSNYCLDSGLKLLGGQLPGLSVLRSPQQELRSQLIGPVKLVVYTDVRNVLYTIPMGRQLSPSSTA